MIPVLAVLQFHLSAYWMLFVAPLWYITLIFDLIKRGVLIFRKVEWERGAFDYSALPHALRKYLEEGTDFLVGAGFVLKEDGLSTFETVAFGQQEVKGFIRLMENPQTGEWATHSFAISWNPSNNRCLLIGTAKRFISFNKEGGWVSAYTNPLTSKAAGKNLHIQFLEESDWKRSLERHRAWILGLGEHSVSLEPRGSLVEYLQKTHEVEIEAAVVQGILFEDNDLNGFRFTLKGTLMALGSFVSGKNRKRLGVKGLKAFTWKIRPASDDKLLRDMAPSFDESGDSLEQRVAPFRISLPGVLYNRFFTFLSNRWLIFFAVVLFWFNYGTLVQLYMDFKWINLLFFLTGFIVDIGLLVLLGTLLSLFLPMGGKRYTDRLGKRLLKFYGNVVCYETPHGVTSCALGNFPGALRFGKNYWVKIPGSESFVLKPKHFERDGFEIFEKEMQKKNLIRPFRTAIYGFWLFSISACVLVWGSLDVQYLKNPSPKQIEGLYSKDQAVFTFVQNETYRKVPKAFRWWLPSLYFSSLFDGDEGMDRAYNIKLNLEVWRIDAKGLTRLSAPLQGMYLVKLSPVGSGFYLSTEEYALKNHEPNFRIYRIENKKVVLLSEKEAEPLLPTMKKRILTLPDGWKSLSGEGWSGYQQEPFSARLPFNYEFSSQAEAQKDKGIVRTISLTRNGKLVAREENTDFEWSEKAISREEYETALRDRSI